MVLELSESIQFNFLHLHFIVRHSAAIAVNESWLLHSSRRTECVFVAVATILGRQYSQQLRIWIFESDSSSATFISPRTFGTEEKDEWGG